MDIDGLKDQAKIPLVLATRNKGKVAEFEVLLKGFHVEILSLKDFDPIPAVEEDGETFEENAVKKARFTAKILGIPALADDSGLTVLSLEGRPGVYSARYAGKNASDMENNQKLLKAMEGMENRAAAFKCVIAIALPDGQSLTYEGSCDGVIAKKMIGDQGFGYDPLFYYATLKKTFAEMPLEEKNLVSHRGKAMIDLKNAFNNVLSWLQQRMDKEV